MGRTGLRPIADLALGGTLKERLSSARAERLSFRQIARLLEDEGINISGETVRQWCFEFGIEQAEAS